ncbi:UNVERIFIED_CONTAM: Dicarboxylate transporter 2.1, chloroplastic [Sesamum radiatum]|uniref:Dicarboxylate transporter 2.1, chloroplastic n=1 Tax=Sesamum radiatum TaxID=300843 RepID=A0AAW2RW67_SESRA
MESIILHSPTPSFSRLSLRPRRPYISSPHLISLSAHKFPFLRHPPTNLSFFHPLPKTTHRKPIIIPSASSGTPAPTESKPPSPPPPPPPQGAKPIPLFISIAIGILTGLGDRIATYFVKWMGKSTLGLSYGLTLSEALIAPAMPSTTARAGGVFLPIIKSLSLSAGSKPGDPSKKKLGSYLVQSQFQCAGNSSGLFLTAAAQNLLCLKLAEELGVVISNPWISWFKAASLPAFLSLLATPLILYKLYPPETKDTPDAPAMAAKKLDAMGPVTKNEWVMIGTMLLAVSLWVFGDALGVPSVVAAMLGLSILLLLGVLDWDDCLSEKSAWDTLAWFAVLVGMAGQLTNLGIVSWMSNCVATSLQSLSLSWPAAFGVLQASYFLIHYLFASQTGHVGALYSAFLAMHLAAGVPGVLSALALAYNTNLFGALTHYSSGQAAVYFGAGYIDLPDVFKFGFLMALINAVIWGVVGTFWWKFLGLY